MSDGDGSHKYQGPNLTLPERASPYPTARGNSAITLVDTAREIERAGESLAHQTNAQLRLIAEQIRWLQEQAQRIVHEAERNLELHRARCSFRRVPGNTYHLYRSENGTFFSLLSPADYGGAPPHEFLGSYRLEPDDTWTEL